MLNSNQKLLDLPFTRGRHSFSDACCTSKAAEQLYRENAGFDMSYGKFESLCKEAWNTEHNGLYFDSLKYSNQRCTILNGSCKTLRIYKLEIDPF